MKIATWNINSIRLRKENVINFLKKENIDILCLQETKTIDEQFPITFFNNYSNTHIFLVYNFESFIKIAVKINQRDFISF